MQTEQIICDVVKNHIQSRQSKVNVTDDQIICEMKQNIERNKSYLRVAIENKDYEWKIQLESLIRTQELHLIEFQKRKEDVSSIS